MGSERIKSGHSLRTYEKELQRQPFKSGIFMFASCASKICRMHDIAIASHRIAVAAAAPVFETRKN